MLSPTEFRDLVSGRRRGLWPSALRGLLRVVESPYTLVVSRRNHRYDRGHAIAQRVGVPVISVGNLTLGGTGKTPIVKWIARRMQELGHSVAIVSRGYGAEAGKQNDEALELARALPGVPHVQNRDRVGAARQVIVRHHPEVILLDDGFQHRRLARDLDIVLLDALEPFGFEHVFPRGTLREPLRGLRRADVVVLSRADAITAAERDTICKRVAGLAPGAAWCEVAHAASALVNANGETQPLSLLNGPGIAAFCGIGNPAGFRHTLAANGCEINAWREFPDHYAFAPTDVASLEDFAHGARLVVCTQKDLVKVRKTDLAGVPLWAIAIEMQFLSGEDAMEHALQRVLHRNT
jgi:tetraacyldisaccharide 4'-kinase